MSPTTNCNLKPACVPKRGARGSAPSRLWLVVKAEQTVAGLPPGFLTWRPVPRACGRTRLLLLLLLLLFPCSCHRAALCDISCTLSASRGWSCGGGWVAASLIGWQGRQPLLPTALILVPEG